MNILIPDSWLREYLDTDATPEQIQTNLSLCGPTVDRIKKVGDDTVYEIEITSNRADMASVYGIARETAAILPRFDLKANLKKLDIKEPLKPVSIMPMAVSDPQTLCNRIMGVVMDVNPIKPSPDFVKDRLEKSGIRSLNNLVDITNYVMLEIGQPTHVFDYDRIKTRRFLIRHAKKDEKIVTLDEKTYLLNSEDVIIDDGTGRIIDLPGIMGTENSVVTQTTRRIFFFIENNNPMLIRKTSMRYGIRTMAATINEKHPDPELVKIALFRGIELYEKIAGGKVAGEIIDVYPNPPKPKEIETSVDFINGRLGINLKKEEIFNILKSLDFSVTEENRALSITPPSYRQFDISIPEDIVEEVARIYGYHNLPVNIMGGKIPVTDKGRDLPIQQKIKSLLKYWGHTETYHYSFISEALIKKAGLNISDHLKLANPLTEETAFMRISLLPSILESLVKNQPYSDNLQLFELSKIYLPQKNNLPKEIPMLSITNQKSFYHLKGIVEGLLAELGIRNFQTDEKGGHFFHPKQIFNFIKDDKLIGSVGTLHPELKSSFGIKKETYIAYLNTRYLVEFYNPIKKYTPIPTYPAIVEDLTIKVTPERGVGDMMEKIYNTDPLIKNVELMTRYEDNLTFRISFQSNEKNLTTADVNRIKDIIPKKLQS